MEEPATTTIAAQEIVIEIGGMAIEVRSDSPEFLEMLEARYSGFLSPEARPASNLLLNW